ncbi:ankyrin [Rickenella mellea]|uniref:Ankyrin n=1 Tax=Rickenella mellea TaxID=50990 RepID=A0A4Y7QD29_9AGAM|nr:ankyrin [Rickenella mellea]
MLHDEFLFSPQDEDTTGDNRSFIDMAEEVAVSQALHCAATSGDISTIRLLVARGADVNAPDSAGRSVIVSLLLGDSAHNGDIDSLECDLLARTVPPLDTERLEALRFLLELRETTLYTLNAPQAVLHGVTPLGMTAYLNQLEAVRLLLEQSGGLVAVDGMDSHGATPLMYASRDGNADVVRCLLENGARPDLKDVNHYSAMQYATRHPLTLWQCETSLRKHRAKASRVLILFAVP